jgi:hypothetical protein
MSTRNTKWGGRRAMKKYLLKWGMNKTLLKRIKFPIFKPPARLYIDDRAFQFKGEFPTRAFIQNFKPWNREK